MEPALPSQDESRRFNVLMEKVYSEFRTFGESLTIVRDDVQSMKPKFDKMTERVDVLELAVRTNSQNISALKDTVHSNTEATRANTEALHVMQADLKNINQRIEVVEAKLTS